MTRNGEPWTDVTLFEEAAYGNLREILYPKKRDVIMNAKIKGWENEWIKEELANADEANRLASDELAQWEADNAIDAGAVESYQGHLRQGIREDAISALDQKARGERDIAPGQEDAYEAEINLKSSRG